MQPITALPVQVNVVVAGGGTAGAAVAARLAEGLDAWVMPVIPRADANPPALVGERIAQMLLHPGA